MTTKSQRLTRQRNWAIYVVRGMLANTLSTIEPHVNTTRLELELSNVLYDLVQLQYRHENHPWSKKKRKTG